MFSIYLRDKLVIINFKNFNSLQHLNNNISKDLFKRFFSSKNKEE
jgi:hypothetical protein